MQISRDVDASAAVGEPRIHFALNFSSIGCPALRPDAYVPARLYAQLDDQLSRLLRDRSRNRLLPGWPAILQVSPIFKWYSRAFEIELHGSHGVGDFLRLHAAVVADSAEARGTIASGQWSLDYANYDWRLNAAPHATAR